MIETLLLLCGGLLAATIWYGWHGAKARAQSATHRKLWLESAGELDRLRREVKELRERLAPFRGYTP